MHSNPTINRGVIQWFSEVKQYGFATTIEADGFAGVDVHVHQNNYQAAGWDDNGPCLVDTIGNGETVKLERTPVNGDKIVFVSRRTEKGMSATAWTYARDWEKAVNAFSRRPSYRVVCFTQSWELDADKQSVAVGDPFLAEIRQTQSIVELSAVLPYYAKMHEGRPVLENDQQVYVDTAIGKWVDETSTETRWYAIERLCKDGVWRTVTQPIRMMFCELTDDEVARYAADGMRRLLDCPHHEHSRSASIHVIKPMPRMKSKRSTSRSTTEASASQVDSPVVGNNTAGEVDTELVASPEEDVIELPASAVDSNSAPSNVIQLRTDQDVKTSTEVPTEDLASDVTEPPASADELASTPDDIATTN